MYRLYRLMDVVETPWLDANRKSILVLGIIAIAAIGGLAGVFIYRRRHKK